MKNVLNRFPTEHITKEIGEPDVQQISIIIPTFNEADNISRLILRLRETNIPIEIIVSDAGSTDNTIKKAARLGAKCVNISEKSRPTQLNAGAALASASLLYFVHADTLPPKGYAEQILKAVQNGGSIGSFRFKFDKNKGLMRLNSYCTRFPLMIFRGGDQSLFIKKSLFDSIGGYDADHIVMEDYDIIRRSKKHSVFTLLNDDIVVSARKYDENSYIRVNWANGIIFSLYYLGVKPVKLLRLYNKMIKHPKA